MPWRSTNTCKMYRWNALADAKQHWFVCAIQLSRPPHLSLPPPPPSPPAAALRTPAGARCATLLASTPHCRSGPPGSRCTTGPSTVPRSRRPGWGTAHWRTAAWPVPCCAAPPAAPQSGVAAGAALQAPQLWPVWAARPAAGPLLQVLLQLEPALPQPLLLPALGPLPRALARQPLMVHAPQLLPAAQQPP